MSVPTNRTAFKAYCLRRLGYPSINIEVDDATIEDRIDEALWHYATFHFDGTEKTYYKYQITEQDKTNKYITLPENIIGAVQIFDLGSAFGKGDLFNVQYQIALNDLWTLTNFSLVPFYMAMEHIQFIQQMLVGKQPITYTRTVNRLYIHTDWNRFAAGDWIVIEAFMVIDPATYVRVWSDGWLQRYATALIKRNWGEVLGKYQEMPLVGGMRLNGAAILADAESQIAKLEEEMIQTYSLPVAFLVG